MANKLTQKKVRNYANLFPNTICPNDLATMIIYKKFKQLRDKDFLNNHKKITKICEPICRIRKHRQEIKRKLDQILLGK